VIEAGRWRWDTTPVRPVTTDDRGEFRFDSLVPGDYVIAVPSTQTPEPFKVVIPLRSVLAIPGPAPGGPLRVYPTTFFPAARSATNAEVISLRSGEARENVQIQLALVTTAVVSGSVIGPEPPPRGETVRLQPDYLSDLTTDRGFESATASLDTVGHFTFLGVTPGHYSLRVATASVSENGRREMAGMTTLVVNDADVPNVVLTLDRGVTVSGRLAFDGALTPPGPQALERFAIRLDPADSTVHRSPTAFRASVDRSGNFRITDVRPGKYVVKFNASVEDRRAMDGWESVGATLAGRDVSTRPMTVQSDVHDILLTLSDHAGRLIGAVHDASGRPDPNACVLLFTTERELWIDSGSTNRRIRGIRAAENGTFVIPVVHAGEYFLTAIPDEDAANWDDPRVLELLTRGSARIVVGVNERKAVDVTTRPIR
jgi:hypothetical protein